MNGEQFRQALIKTELTQRGAARFFGVALSTVQEWLEVGPSPPATVLMQIMLHHRWTGAYVEREILGR